MLILMMDQMLNVLLSMLISISIKNQHSFPLCYQKTLNLCHLQTLKASQQFRKRKIKMMPYCLMKIRLSSNSYSLKVKIMKKKSLVQISLWPFRPKNPIIRHYLVQCTNSKGCSLIQNITNMMIISKTYIRSHGKKKISFLTNLSQSIFT